ncbi:hypothetical protein BDV09DRAFT_163114 [Aspergillus tetrazonus]
MGRFNPTTLGCVPTAQILVPRPSYRYASLPAHRSQTQSLACAAIMILFMLLLTQACRHSSQLISMLIINVSWAEPSGKAGT